MNRRPRTALMLLLLAVIARESAAHPVATATVDMTLGAGATVSVAIAMDADALRLKEEALRQRAADLVFVAFDGVAAALREQSRVTGSQTVVTLTGTIPPAARSVTWRSTLIYGTYAVTIRQPGREPAVEWLQGPQESAPYRLIGSPARATAGRLFGYIRLGFTHILPDGLDHILFVLGLFLLNSRLRPVLTQVSAFTLAHSITLGLSLYGVVSAPATVVEPMIALSIAYVAIENLFTSKLRPWRIALVFLFGLLHGLGFAEALSSLHLPRSEFMTTLVLFNSGVELGQLTVISMAALLLRLLVVDTASYRARIVRPASMAIALVGVVWTVERVVSV